MRAIVALVLLAALPFAFAQTEQEAREALGSAQEDLEEMSALGLSTTFVKDALRLASKALDEGDYPTVMAKVSDISARKERALTISDSLRALDFRIKDAEEKGLDASAAKEMRGTAIDAFERENYDEAEEFIFLSNKNLNDAEAEFSIVQARLNAARDNALTYLREHKLRILFATLLVILLGFTTYRFAAIYITQRRLADLELEKDVLADLMEKAQVDYFKKNAIPRSTYDIYTQRYGERTIEIDQLIPVLRTRLERLRRYDLSLLMPSG